MKSRSARNPSRRNRNIGTPKAGHGKNNRLVIPSSPAGIPFFERLGQHSAIPIRVQDRQITFIIEKTRRDSAHACTIDDVVRILEALPAADWDGIEYIVLRQPKRKEEILKPSWGRLVYSFKYQDNYAPAIVLDANSLDRPIRWGRRLDPEDQLEIERLRRDGLPIVETKRNYILKPDLTATRSVQLYRTLLHEIGHWVDYKRSPEESYGTKISREKEAFAHHYATAVAGELRKLRVIPFERIWDTTWESIDERDFILKLPASRP